MGISDRLTLGGFVITIVSIRRSHSANKKLNNYTLYNQKRHEIYPEMYKLLIETINSMNIKNQILLQSYPSEQFSREDIQQQISEIGIPGKKEQKLLELYNSKSRPKLDKELFDLKQKKKIINYNQSLNLLKEYYIKNECYLSESIIKTLDEYIILLDNLSHKYDTENYYKENQSEPKEKRELSDEINRISENLNTDLIEIRYHIQKELEII